jgi:phosphodiesterase/alkaline phosphatase D-like protein
MRRWLLPLVLAVPLIQAQTLKLPLQPDSVKFAVIGDSGTGLKPQYDTARQMSKYRAAFPFDFVIMLGDNIYDGASAADYRKKFEDPYRQLLDSGVKFFASLGNQDDPGERSYKPFNMGGNRYYSFQRGAVDFFALDSNAMDTEQLAWLKAQLSASRSTWKICFFHHPLYSHTKSRLEDVNLRKRLEPVLQEFGVGAVFSGHDHVYERIKPQRGIYYFVLGNSGQLRLRDLRSSVDTVKGFDTDRSFGMVEITGDKLYFQTVSRTGDTVDSGVLPLLQAPR